MTAWGVSVFVLQGVLLCIALARGKHDRIVMVLFAAYVASSLLGPSLEGTQRATALGVIDALIVAGMALLWTVRDDMRAWTIGIIGTGKVGLRLAYVTDPYMDHLVYASLVNCALLAQIIAAGGYADAIGVRLDGLFRRIAPRRHGLLRNGAR